MTDARKDTLDCLIVGAGPVGLFQALNLCRLGISGVRIIDKSSEPSKYSKALAVHARYAFGSVFVLATSYVKSAPGIISPRLEFFYQFLFMSSSTSIFAGLWSVWKLLA